MKEIIPSQVSVESYFVERPLALPVTELLRDHADGLTATDLALELHVSVPTMYRLTGQMWRLNFLKAERDGRKLIFTLNSEIIPALPQIAERVQRALSRTTSSHYRLSLARNLIEQYPLPLSPRATQILVTSVIKQNIHKLLPTGVRPRRPGKLSTVIGESAKFDLYIGTEEKFVAVEMKIIETAHHVRDRLGILATVSASANRGLAAIVIAYLLTPLGGQWIIEEESVGKLLSSISRPELPLLAVISKATPQELLDVEFTERFAKRITQKVREGLGIE